MSYNLPGFTAPDEYGAEPGEVGVLRCQDTVRVRLNVVNQPIFWQRGLGLVGGSVGEWEPEEELPPGKYSLTDRCDAIRVRAAVPAATLKQKEAEEPKRKFPQAFVSVACRVAQELGA